MDPIVGVTMMEDFLSTSLYLVHRKHTFTAHSYARHGI